MKSFTKTILICLLVVCTLQPFPIVSAEGEGWLDGWDWRMTVSITNSTGAGTNYQIFLNVSSRPGMQADFDDIRFTDDDGETLLDYWKEEYDASTYALFWVEVADDLDSNQKIYLYWGNDAVSSASDGAATWLFYEDWESETINLTKWDIIENDGSVSFDPRDANHGSMIKIDANAGTDVYELRTDDTVSASTSAICRVFTEATVAASQRTVFGMGSLAAAPLALVRSIDGSEDYLALDDDSNSDSDSLAAEYFDQFRTFMITRNGTHTSLYAEYELVTTLDIDPDSNANVVFMLYVRDSEYQLYSDWIAQRKFVDPEPSVLIGEWQIIGDAEFFFPVSWDPTSQFGFDAFFIILGLIMIPTSTLYLAYGVKHDRSSNRLYYGIIIFLLGCGLFVGGILPP